MNTTLPRLHIKALIDLIKGLPIMYASQDLQICVHECRVTAEDDLYVATLAPSRDMKLLDLTELLTEDVSEFESLDFGPVGPHMQPSASASLD